MDPNLPQPQQPLPQAPQVPQRQPQPQPQQPGQFQPPVTPAAAPQQAPLPPAQPLPPVPAPVDFDPSKSPTEQLTHHGPEQIGMGVGNNDAGRQDAKHVTRLPFTVAGGPLPAIALGIIILVFLLVVVLYAFL